MPGEGGWLEITSPKTPEEGRLQGGKKGHTGGGGGARVKKRTRLGHKIRSKGVALLKVITGGRKV